jgi:hypothetical protein
VRIDMGARLGFGAIVVGLFSIAAFYLWPDKKWIGWAALICCLLILLAWIIFEITRSPSELTKEGTSTSVGNVNSGIAAKGSSQVTSIISPTTVINHPPAVLQRPDVRFVGWKFRDYTYQKRDGGFELENHGDVASEVRVIPFEIALSVSVSSSVVPTIGQGKKEFALVWVDGFGIDPLNMEKWDLQKAMKKASEDKQGVGMFRPNYSVSVSVSYRDIDNEFYLSTAELSYVPATGELVFGPTSQKKVPHR